jgi:hypothetical protein
MSDVQSEHEEKSVMRLILSFMSVLFLFAVSPAEEPRGEKVPAARIHEGELSVLFRDNSESPKNFLSGIDALFNVKDAPGFDAFDPDQRGASAGLNYEHIICGHPDLHNIFSPRIGPQGLYRLPDGKSVVLVREASDDPRSVSSAFRYTVTAPHYIDFEFRCVPHDAKRFGSRGYAIFFWADYMNDVAEVPLHFRGVKRDGGPETWIAADAPEGHKDWDKGGTYRHVSADPLEYDADHNVKLNIWSYDYPRYTLPFYYGRTAHDMVYILMFDRSHTETDEMRFSIFKFKLPKRQRPAWDFQYVIHRVESNKEYGFRGRAVWKKFVSPEDCLKEYKTWAARRAIRSTEGR